MTSTRYRLFGFVSALNIPPCFATPIFIKDDELYVQGERRKDKIQSFEKFQGGSIDIYQDGEPEYYDLNSSYVYCVQDRGPRTIFGNKEYVARYLKQNLRKYLDAPFFLNEASEFGNSFVPEALHLSEGTDELEMQIIANSLRDFVNAGHVKAIKLSGANEALNFAVSTPEAYMDYFFAFSIADNSLSSALKRWHLEAVQTHPRLSLNRRLSHCISFSEQLFPNEIDYARSDVRHIHWYTIKILEDVSSALFSDRSLRQNLTTLMDLDLFLNSLILKKNYDHESVKKIISSVKRQIEAEPDRLNEASLLSHVLFLLISFAVRLYYNAISKENLGGVIEKSALLKRLGSFDEASQKLHDAVGEGRHKQEDKGEALRRPSTVRSAKREANKKIALVIGNSAYRNAPSLSSAADDARKMSALLTLYGFDVIGGSNLAHHQFKAALGEFAQPAATKLFFFEGHGLQSKGENYLLPVDANIETENSIHLTTLPIAGIVEQMQSSSATSIIFLDASRDSSIKPKWISRSNRGFAGQIGLAPMRGGKGTYIAFSNRPGEAIIDTDRSLFVDALLSNLTKARSVDIDELMRRVRIEVSHATDERQIPWAISWLVSPFKFRPNDTNAWKPISKFSQER
jgi:hypothetical protein